MLLTARVRNGHFLCNIVTDQATVRVEGMMDCGRLFL